MFERILAWLTCAEPEELEVSTEDQERQPADVSAAKTPRWHYFHEGD